MKSLTWVEGITHILREARPSEHFMGKAGHGGRRESGDLGYSPW